MHRQAASSPYLSCPGVPPTTFQIHSDLHLKTHASYDFRFMWTAPNLALLGDIGRVAYDNLGKGGLAAQQRVSKENN
jgi:hypothetical protein